MIVHEVTHSVKEGEMKSVCGVGVQSKAIAEEKRSN